MSSESVIYSAAWDRLFDEVAVPVLLYLLPYIVRRQRQPFGAEVLPFRRVDEELRGDALGCRRRIEAQAEGIRNDEYVLVCLHAGGEGPLDFLRVGDIDIVVEDEDVLDAAA